MQKDFASEEKDVTSNMTRIKVVVKGLEISMAKEKEKVKVKAKAKVRAKAKAVAKGLGNKPEFQ
jgi:hypothetical protein